MQSAESRIWHSDIGSSLIERLPDGSVVICEQRTRNVHSLKPEAAFIWNNCADGATREQLSYSFTRRTSDATPDAFDEILAQLESAGLIRTETPVHDAPSLERRSMLRKVAVVAPVVLTLTAAEQLAYAKDSKSGRDDKGRGRDR
jgi:hypothetical protein